jgi:hypothetical protein
MANKDTENKRRGGLTPLLVLPKPDGTIAQADRQHKVRKYPGVVSVVPTGISAFDLEWQVKNTSPEYALANTSPEYRVANTSPEYQAMEK